MHPLVPPLVPPRCPCDCPPCDPARVSVLCGPQSVIMRYPKRASLCISSQVGCRMACRFCSTGTMGLRANLPAGEMLEQVCVWSCMCV